MRLEESSRFCMISILLILDVISHSEARIFYQNVTLMYGLGDASVESLRSEGFGFANIGTLEFHVSCPLQVGGVRPDLWLLACTSQEWRDAQELKTSRLNPVCESLQNSRMAFSQPARFCKSYQVRCSDPLQAQTNAQCAAWKARALFPERDYLKFMLLQCPGRGEYNGTLPLKQGDESCRVNLTLMNNNGHSHLSQGEEPLLLIHKVLIVVWGSLLFLWIINWIKYYWYSNALHKILFVAPSLKFFMIIILIIRWEYINATGRDCKVFEISSYVVRSAEQAMLFMVMMLASEGWCVVRPKIRNIRHALLPVLFLAFLGSVICVVWVHSYFMAFAVCSIVFVIYRALKWCSYNVELINRQMLITTTIMRQKEITFRDGMGFKEQCIKKRDIFLRLRLVCAVYTMVFAIVTTMATFLSEYAWVREITFEVPEILVFTALGIIFRLRDFSAYENIEIIIPQEKSSVMFLPYPDMHWPKRQKIMMAIPIDPPAQSDATKEEEKALLKAG
ncbi:uncharacterized protein [Diadema setosum]|uniref:uncharacterized protein n=1 Tax=Diadema setosum TaxID=31175 RepID=UPI003B3BE35F